jgi:hypothetical protein
VADCGFQWRPTSKAVPQLADHQIRSPITMNLGRGGRANAACPLRDRIEGRISHLKRATGYDERD